MGLMQLMPQLASDWTQRTPSVRGRHHGGRAALATVPGPDRGDMSHALGSYTAGADSSWERSIVSSPERHMTTGMGRLQKEPPYKAPEPASPLFHRSVSKR